jgi:type IV pilus assembly protein PilA
MSSSASTGKSASDVRPDSGFTLIELLVVIGIIGVVAAIAVPALLAARVAANEGAAIGSIRAVNSAQASYHSTAGGGGYAAQLGTLGNACPGSNEGFLSPDLVIDPAVKAGYAVTLQASAGAQPVRTDCNGTMTQTAYYVTAVPAAFARTGTRAFASNSAGSIYFDPSGVAPTEAAMASGGGGKVIQ